MKLLFYWRCLAESNRPARFCRPLPNLSAKAPFLYCIAKVVFNFNLTKYYQSFLLQHDGFLLFCPFPDVFFIILPARGQSVLLQLPQPSLPFIDLYTLRTTYITAAATISITIIFCIILQNCLISCEYNYYFAKIHFFYL